MSLLLLFGNAGTTPPPPTGQSPAASRYRKGYRVNYVNLWWLVLAIVGWRR